ncbi:MAG: serine protease [Polyangiales bacterium]|nr:serine protease [Myxococcales bacterium]MCB9656822.1 serine protease [Sandaracinaceae bacterium]
MWAGLVASALLGLACWPLAGRALYGGADVAPDRAGSAVMMRWRRGSWWGTCSGVVVAPDAVLTAGHCVRSATLGELQVRNVQVGHPRNRPERGTVRQVVVHPSFDAQHPERGNDLAVLRLSAPLTRAQPVPLAALSDNVMLAGPRVRILGFGVTRSGGRGSARLRDATLESLSPFHCFSGDVQGMAQTRFCAASPEAGVCPGDSGAPALLSVEGVEHVVGIVSLAVDNSSRCVESAAVITRVSAFREWVQTASH